MREPIDAILLERTDEPGGLARMAGVSLVAHGLLVAIALMTPSLWSSSRPDRSEGTVMTISLGPAPGPQAGGMNAIGARPIQEVVPAPAAPRPEPVRPPAARTPEMTMPDPAAKAKEAPKGAATVKAAPDEAKGRAPTRGAETRAGSAIVETGATGANQGLTTFGGGGTGGYLDTKDFCCPEYLVTMLNLIQRNWNGKQGVNGAVLMKFTIRRDGELTAIEVETTSGYSPLDMAAQRALIMTKQLPVLPAAFVGEQLPVHINFIYQR